MVKVIEKINRDEVINHTGDLSVKGDIDENAQVNITNGSLTILGNIKDSARIKISLSEDLRESPATMASSNALGNFVMMGGVNIIGGESISCDIKTSSGNQQVMMGNVNINNRILTNDQVTKLGNNKYKITSASSNPMTSVNRGWYSSIIINGVRQQPQESASELATATIDGKKYHGKEIIVDGTNVLVDGKSPSAEGNPSGAAKKPAEASIIIIHGTIGNTVTIDSDAEIEARGAIGNFCNIKSSYSNFKGNYIGQDSKIDAAKDITATTVNKNAALTSQYGGLKAIRINENVTIKTFKSIEITEDVGDRCSLESQYNGVQARNMGEKVVVNAYKDITAKSIGSGSRLKSQYQGVESEFVGNNVKIHAYKDIISDNMGDDCNVKSEYQNITVRGFVGQHVTINAYKDIEVGSLGDQCTLISNYQTITIGGAAGNRTTLKAYKDIDAQDLGDKCILTSDYQSIKVRNLGEGTSISAYKNITIEGYCPNDADLQSSYGKIKKSQVAQRPVQQRFQAPAPVIVPVAAVPASIPILVQAPVISPTAQANAKYQDNHQENAYLEGKYESDLQHAILLSSAQSLKKQGLMAVPAAVEKQRQKADEIPESYICLITQEIMLNPVMCTLDGRTYEETAIKEWLEKRRTAPNNRAELKPGQSIDEVLIKNYNIASAIEEFRSNNPQLFGGNQNSL